MRIKHVISLGIILSFFTVSAASASFETVHPHVGNTYWVGADGHKISLINNDNAKNPTYSELISFIKTDRTDERIYKPGKFTCGDFAELVHNNAEKAGIKAAWVSIHFTKNNKKHVCNAFKTTDKGLVYVDCTSSYPHKSGSWDSVVKLQVGKPYKPTSLFRSGFTYNCMGNVKSFGRFW